MAAADEICIAVALDSWQPTRGTRLTGQRNAGQHFIFFEQSVGACRYATGAHLEFAAPFGPSRGSGSLASRNRPHLTASADA